MTDLQQQSDDLFDRMRRSGGKVRVVLDKPMGQVPAGAVFWTHQPVQPCATPASFPSKNDDFQA